MTVSIRALVGGHTVASGTLVRRTEAAGLTAKETTLSEEGFVGTYYRLRSRAPAPAVVQLGGSLGGHSELPAATIASHGYPTLSLAYFKEPGLPQALRRLPLEYFATALRWLGRQPGVDPRRLVVLGVSRGGEAALLAAVNFPDLAWGVITCTGSADVQGSLPEGDAAWTIDGRPVPQGPIPIEKIAGPVLAFGGGRDAVWSSAASVQELADRARAHGRRDIVGHVYWKAGHGVGCAIPNVPFVGQMDYPVGPGVSLARGGTLAANEQAAAAAWRLVRGFLARLRR